MDIYRTHFGKKNQFTKVPVSELVDKDIFVIDKSSDKLSVVTLVQVTQIKYVDIGTTKEKKIKKDKNVFRLVSFPTVLLSTISDGEYFTIEPHGNVFQRIADFSFGVYVKELETNEHKYLSADFAVGASLK
jgi:hypothetical protein